MQELLNFCQSFHAAHYLPVAAFRSGERLFSAGFPEALQEYGFISPSLLGEVQPPCIGMLPDQALYGMIRLERTGDVLLIGPAYNGGITDAIVRRYIAQHNICVYQLLCHPPAVLRQVLLVVDDRHLCMVHDGPV